MAAALPDPAARLFRSLPRPYQRHALNVAARLERLGPVVPSLRTAALFHDAGKWDPIARRRVPILYRALATILAGFPQGRVLLRRLAAGPPSRQSWRYPWYLQHAHPVLGAQLAAQAGLSSEIVTLVRYHEDAAGAPPDLQPLLRLLQAADNQE